MLAAARSSLRRASAVRRDVPLPIAVLERPRSEDGAPKLSSDTRDGTLWQGYASGWIFDGRKGFYEHQPEFLKAPPRC